jgi:hypothetical protein
MAAALEVLVKAPFPVVEEARVAGSSVGFVVEGAFAVDFEREVPSQRLPEGSRVGRRYLISNRCVKRLARFHKPKQSDKTHIPRLCPVCQVVMIHAPLERNMLSNSDRHVLSWRHIDYRRLERISVWNP